MNEPARDWIAKLLDPWELLGFGGQLCFSGRFAYQWWRSEKAKAVVLPRAFWYLSIGGAGCMLVYTFHKGAPSLFIAQSVALVFYLRNLMLQRNTAPS